MDITIVEMIEASITSTTPPNSKKKTKGSSEKYLTSNNEKKIELKRNIPEEERVEISFEDSEITLRINFLKNRTRY